MVGGTCSGRQQHSLKVSGTFAVSLDVLAFKIQTSKHADAGVVDPEAQTSQWLTGGDIRGPLLLPTLDFKTHGLYKLERQHVVMVTDLQRILNL